MRLENLKICKRGISWSMNFLVYIGKFHKFKNSDVYNCMCPEGGLKPLNFYDSCEVYILKSDREQRADQKPENR